MFLRRAQADDTNSVVIGAFGKDHYIEIGTDQPDSDEADFSVIEPVVLALQRCVPFEAGCLLQRNTVLGTIDLVFCRIELDSHRFYVHPLNNKGKR